MEREAQERWGERLAYCRVALDHLNTCIKLSKVMLSLYASTSQRNI